MIITSKENDIVKHIRKLKDKKERDISNEFVVEGIKMLEEAINENAKINPNNFSVEVHAWSIFDGSIF